MSAANRPWIFGLIEGFYGVFYTFPEREDLIRFLGQHGFNFYLYAPKNDRQHRTRWREPYPGKVMAQFASAIALARQAGVDFCYGISPGVSIRYSSAEDFDCLVSKLAAFHQIGVRSFALLLDDLKAGFVHPEDAALYASPAEAQSELANRLLRSLKSLDPAAWLLVCPGEYYGSTPFSPGLMEMAHRLDPQIGLFYTGPEICSPTITAADAQAFAAASGRAPIVWDNYPVNDLSMQPELHLNAVTGRDPALLGATGGFLINAMIQAEATKIPLLTYAAFCQNPGSYDPEQAWLNAAAEICGPENLEVFSVLADCVHISCLHPGRRSKLSTISQDAIDAIRRGEDFDTVPAILALEEYLVRIDEACYQLKFRMENLALRSSLLPWIEVLEHWMWMTRRALTAMRAHRQGLACQDTLVSLKEYKQLIEQHPKHIAGQALMQLADWVVAQVESPSASQELAQKLFSRLPQLWPTRLRPIRSNRAA